MYIFTWPIPCPPEHMQHGTMQHGTINIGWLEELGSKNVVGKRGGTGLLDIYFI